ncbi:glycosyltransferase [Asanoa hainanensis]|uniref:glycosyltransferase n=1 Tax=Asanoa hainanensis TaxID=560556 RepID=UPI000B790692|nr:nucleotide disphospho-sugar-binding domain-containing protein [Asanoa hainanensis]
MAATPLFGHVTPVRRIAADLARRGHDVVFATGPEFRDQVEEAGLRFVALSGIAAYGPERQREVHDGRVHLTPGPEQLDFDFTEVFYRPIPEQHATIQRVLAEAPDEPTVLVTDQSFMGQWPVRLGAPGIRPAAYVGIGVVPLSMNSVDTAPFGLGLPPDSSPEGRARNAVQNRMVGSLFANSTEFLARILRDLGATELMPFPMDAIVTLPDRFLQLAISDVEYPRSDAPPGLRFVGMLPPDPAGVPGELPPWWGDVLAAERVVAVTQGTVSNRDSGMLIEPTLRALADLDVLVVATTVRDDVVLSEVPANARVARFVPHDLLLPHTDVLVTNGGYGGSLKALSYGVPLVIAGASEDKIEVAARLAWTGAAINLVTETPTPEEIRTGVETVLGDDEFRARARELRAAAARHDAFDEIARTVKELGG